MFDCLRPLFRQTRSNVKLAVSLGIILSGLHALPSNAAEYAKGIYLLGSSASGAALLPPPGKYGSSIKYFYSGTAAGGTALSIGRGQTGNLQLQADVDAEVDIFIEVPTLIWISPQKVLNGTLGFGALVPIGWQDVAIDIDALATLTLPNGTTLQAGRQLGLNDETFAFGDPLLTAFIGWNRGNWHWKLAGLLNVPIGSYDQNDLANMGFNRWAFDVSGAMTWLDPSVGFEVSATAGFTLNGENPDTNYKTGTEFHLEYALMQHFSKAFAIGLTGYHYQQVTGDSGSGATLGPFKGRVSAIGPNINYNFQLGPLPVFTSFRWLHEFNAKNRLEGDAVFFTATIPLGAPRH